MAEAPDEKTRTAYFQPFIDESGKKRCGAAVKTCRNCSRRFTKDDRLLLLCPDCNEDRRCTQSPRPNKDRCKIHAGSTLPNPLNQKRLTMSSALPVSVRERYQEALKAIDLTSVLEEYALVRTRMTILAERLEGGDSEKWWEDLRKLCDQVDKHMDADERDKALDAISDMMDLIRKGAQERDQWDELLQLNTMSAKLKDRQSAIEHRRKAYLSATEALSLITNLAAAMREALTHVRDNWLDVRDRLKSEMAVPTLTDAIVQRIESGEDPREAVQAAMHKWFLEVDPSRLSSSIESADDIVQTRVVQLLEGPS